MVEKPNMGNLSAIRADQGIGTVGPLTKPMRGDAASKRIGKVVGFARSDNSLLIWSPRSFIYWSINIYLVSLAPFRLPRRIRVYLINNVFQQSVGLS